jgi:hypothetical protein
MEISTYPQMVMDKPDVAYASKWNITQPVKGRTHCYML